MVILPILQCCTNKSCNFKFSLFLSLSKNSCVITCGFSGKTYFDLLKSFKFIETGFLKYSPRIGVTTNMRNIKMNNRQNSTVLVLSVDVSHSGRMNTNNIRLSFIPSHTKNLLSSRVFRMNAKNFELLLCNTGFLHSSIIVMGKTTKDKNSIKDSLR